MAISTPSGARNTNPHVLWNHLNIWRTNANAAQAAGEITLRKTQKHNPLVPRTQAREKPNKSTGSKSKMILRNS